MSDHLSNSDQELEGTSWEPLHQVWLEIMTAACVSLIVVALVGVWAAPVAMLISLGLLLSASRYLVRYIILKAGAERKIDRGTDSLNGVDNAAARRRVRERENARIEGKAKWASRVSGVLLVVAVVTITWGQSMVARQQAQDSTVLSEMREDVAALSHGTTELRDQLLTGKGDGGSGEQAADTKVP